MRRPAPALLSLLLALGGCGDSWLGGSEEAPLPGERVPVLLIDDALNADPALAGQPVVLPPPSRNPSWPQAMANPAHAPEHVDLPDDLEPAWQAGIGAGDSSSRRLLGPPVVSEDAVFTIDARGRVSAFATADGRRLWRVAPSGLDDSDRLRAGGLAYANGRVFITTGSGEALALDARTGEELWRRGVLAPVRTAPAVAEGRVILTTSNNQTFALNAATGDVLWQHAGFAEQTAILGGAVPAVQDGVAVVAYSSGEVFALDLASGQPLWSDTVLRPRRTLAIGAISDITGNPVIEDGRVLVAGNGGEMASLRLSDGLRLWDLDLTSSNTPWVAGAYAYVLTDRNELVAVIRDDGGIRWVSPLQRLRDPGNPNSSRVFWSGPVLAGDRLILASSDGEAISVSPYTGEVLGRIDLPDGVSVPPVVAAGTLYFLTQGGRLVAYR